MPAFIDGVGEKWGRLTIRKRIANVGRRIRYLADCDCGTKGVKVFIAMARAGQTKSCGCLKEQYKAQRKANARPDQMFGYLDDWKPRPDTVKLLADIKQVLREYRKQLPLTVRQIYYRLIAKRIGYDKGEEFENRLYYVCKIGRRAREIDFRDIRDDGGEESGVGGWANAEEYIDNLRNEADYFTMDERRGQKLQIVVCCEAVGMFPQIESAVSGLGARVLSGGGFDSLTQKWKLAQSLGRDEEKRDAVILHIGDYDEAGLNIYNALIGDVAAFAMADFGIRVTGRRVAITPEQIAHYGFEPERVIKRGKPFNTVQAEALPPDELARIVRAAVMEYVDQDAFAAMKALERRERANVKKALGSLLKKRR
jgi:hypothetical protein